MKFTNKLKPHKTGKQVAKLHDDDSDVDIKLPEGQLGYYKKTRAVQLLEIPIDEEIKGPSYYRSITQAIRDSSEGDIIQFNICSPGGRLDGLMTILSATWKTEAQTEAHLDGFCDSAASMLALHCDSIFVSPLASMLVHNVAYGIGGKAADIKAHVDHFNAFSEKFFRETYKYFLSEEEIDKCLEGYQLYLDAEQIMERLRFKFDKMKELAELELEQEEQEQLESEVGASPKQRKARSRKTTE